MHKTKLLKTRLSSLLIFNLIASQVFAENSSGNNVDNYDGYGANGYI